MALPHLSTCQGVPVDWSCTLHSLPQPLVVSRPNITLSMMALQTVCVRFPDGASYIGNADSPNRLVACGPLKYGGLCDWSPHFVGRPDVVIQCERLYTSRFCSVEWALLYFVLFGALVSAFLYFWGEHGYVVPGSAKEVERQVARPRMRIEPKETQPRPEVRYIAAGAAEETVMEWYDNAVAGNPRAQLPSGIFFMPDVAAGHRTQAVSGDLRNLSSLDALLAGSGLRWQVITPGQTVVVSELALPDDSKTRDTTGR